MSSGDTAVTAMETAEPEKTNLNTDKINSKDGEAADIEFQIRTAMRSRATYFRDQADSITLESVRRLLEEDMGLEKYALDVHKSFVKEHLVRCLEDTGNGASETEKKDDATPVKEAEKLSEEQEEKDDARDETVGDEKMKGSVEMDILTEENTSKTVAEDTKDEANNEALMSDIRRALQKRSSYVKANSEKVTMGSLRRLLEQDLKLEKHSLDPFKKFINEELEVVLQIPDAPKSSTKSIVKNPKKKVKITPSKEVENSDSDIEGDVDDEEVAVKKTTTRKRKSEMTGKLVSGKKKAKLTETDSENDSDAEDSEMKVEKPLKKAKEAATPVYGKRVENLKSVIKSCGMSIPPNVYRKAKQAPEEKREATLIEELEQILAKEGLSSNPSEKEIKEVKKKKNRSKELEGIDTSNIVSNTRRRSTTSFAPPPKPKITEESESDSESDDEPEDSENEEEEEEGEEEEGKEGNEEAGEGSQSEEEEDEESNKEDEDDDDGGEESE